MKDLDYHYDSHAVIPIEPNRPSIRRLQRLFKHAGYPIGL